MMNKVKIFLLLLLSVITLSSGVNADILQTSVLSNSYSSINSPAYIPDPILFYVPSFLSDIKNSTASTFVRSSVAVRKDGWQVPSNWPLYCSSTDQIWEYGRLNKVTSVKVNPGSVGGSITKGGDAASILDVVDDAATLAAYGLSAYGPKVYRLDNSLGTTQAYAIFGGNTNNTNPHSLSVIIRSTGSVRLEDSWTGQGIPATTYAQYVRLKKENIIPSAGSSLAIRAYPGAIAYFIMPQLEESATATDPITGNGATGVAYAYPRWATNPAIMLLEGLATNKVTCAKSNPGDLTNISKGGDAAAVLSVADDSGALAAVGLQQYGPKVYKLDNSLGTAVAYAVPNGTTGNTNPHSLSAFMRVTAGTGKLQDSVAGSGPVVVTSSTYSRAKKENFTPTSASAGLAIRAEVGAVVYFVLPQLEEGPVCTSPIPGSTGTVARASAGSDTSGNGLQLPLTQAMIDCFRGEMIDWTGAWSNYSSPASLTTTTDAANKKITWPGGSYTYIGAQRPGTLTIGQTYEISYTVSGRTAGSVVPLAGSEVGISRSANGTYTERLKSTSTNALTFEAYSFNGSVTINYVRRVLENGQTNRGEGTQFSVVDFPWAWSTYPQGTQVNIWGILNSPSFGLFCDYASARRIKLGEQINQASSQLMDFTTPIRLIVVSQWSAVTGQMRCGIWNPATKTLTWGSYATYRGFFPIYTTNQRLRWFYGSSTLPIGIGPMLLYDRILDDDQIRWLCADPSMGVQ